MMRDPKQKLNLHQPATYQIAVPGALDESRLEWLSGMTIAVERKGEGPPLTILTVTLDQAALQGLLRRLYSLGLPIVSVECIDGQSLNQARS